MRYIDVENMKEERQKQRETLIVRWTEELTVS